MEGDFRIDQWLAQPQLNTILSPDNATIQLEPKVMAVLVCLANHASEVLAKDRIIQTVWADTFVTEDVLKRAVSELRKAFADDPDNPRFIQTVPKRGYRTPDGKRFVVVKFAGEPREPITQINLVQGWFEELKRQAPPRRP